MMDTLVAEAESVREGIGKTVVRNLKVMARMGTFFEDAMRRTYPEFPLRSGILSWEDYLPPLKRHLVGTRRALRHFRRAATFCSRDRRAMMSCDI